MLKYDAIYSTHQVLLVKTSLGRKWSESDSSMWGDCDRLENSLFKQSWFLSTWKTSRCNVHFHQLEGPLKPAIQLPTKMVRIPKFSRNLKHQAIIWPAQLHWIVFFQSVDLSRCDVFNFNLFPGFVYTVFFFTFDHVKSPVKSPPFGRICLPIFPITRQATLSTIWYIYIPTNLP